jgi:stage V sporulation protein AE
MFTKLNAFFLKLFTDFQTTFIWVFIIGVLISAIGVWAGDEQNAPRFKKGLVMSIVGTIVFLLAKPIIDYVKANL